MYCNAACKKRHRSKHKKECERRVAELHDEKLFKQPQPLEDCPICMIRLPTLGTGQTYMPCCGKVICCGCLHAFRSRATKQEHDLCPFCRTPPTYSNGEYIKRYKKRVEMNDIRAMCSLGRYYALGQYGLPQNSSKAFELYHRAGELGNADAYTNVGGMYMIGEGVDVNGKMGVHYLELAVIGGSSIGRLNLGNLEARLGNTDRALKHYMIAVKDGDTDSLKKVKHLYQNGQATKDDYAKALRSYQAYLEEIKSDQRDEAAAANATYKYYESSYASRPSRVFPMDLLPSL